MKENKTYKEQIAWYLEHITPSKEIADILSELCEQESENAGLLDMEPLEDAVFGKREECPKGCGTMVLPGLDCHGC